MSFKKAKEIEPTVITESEFVYIWDDSDPKNIQFKKVLKNFQEEINKFNGCDLKSLIEKNIMPNIEDKKPMYLDETIYKDIDQSKLFELSNIEVQIDEETGEVLNEEIKNKINPINSEDSKEIANDSEPKNK